MNFSSRKLVTTSVLAAVALFVALNMLAYIGAKNSISNVAQVQNAIGGAVTSGLTPQTPPNTINTVNNDLTEQTPRVPSGSGVGNDLVKIPVASGYETAVKFSTGYSSTQGKNNWSYQYGKDNNQGIGGPDTRDTLATVSNFADMAWTNNRWQANSTIIYKGVLHPGVEHVAALKWTAPKAGQIKISGTVADGDAGGGDGVKARILKESSKLWESGYIANGDTSGKSHLITTSVTKGQAIYFIVDNNSKGNTLYDSTKWDPSIAYKVVGDDPDPDPDPGLVKGAITSVGTDATGTFVEGWACQEGVDSSITVDIYAGAAKGRAGSSLIIKTPATNIDSPANVHTACDTPTSIKHNFKYYFTPAALIAHGGKVLFLYGNSTTGASGDKILGKSGQVALPPIGDPGPSIVKGSIASVGKILVVPSYKDGRVTKELINQSLLISTQVLLKVQLTASL